VDDWIEHDIATDVFRGPVRSNVDIHQLHDPATASGCAARGQLRHARASYDQAITDAFQIIFLHATEVFVPCLLPLQGQSIVSLVLRLISVLRGRCLPWHVFISNTTLFDMYRMPSEGSWRTQLVGRLLSRECEGVTVWKSSRRPNLWPHLTPNCAPICVLCAFQLDNSTGLSLRIDS
jgi:hypothetical protein